MYALQIKFLFLLFGFQIANGVDNGVESRVFGGKPLRLDVHKYLVKLEKYYGTAHISECSGSIIHNSWVLTAAHCCDKNFDLIKIFHPTIFGSISEITFVEKNNVFVYPYYKGVGSDRRIRADLVSTDIALMKTTLPIEFNEWVQPIILSNHPWKSGPATIAGFGKPHLGVPREGDVLARSYSYGPGIIISNNIVGPGSGDSGGALVSQGYLIGVTSAATSANGYYWTSYYVDVAAKAPWITEVISKS